jgi:hypothetical protein
VRAFDLGFQSFNMRHPRPKGCVTNTAGHREHHAHVETDH